MTRAPEGGDGSERRREIKRRSHERQLRLPPTEFQLAAAFGTFVRRRSELAANIEAAVRAPQLEERILAPHTADGPNHAHAAEKEKRNRNDRPEILGAQNPGK